MTQVTVGTGGTIKSTSAEGQLLELATFIRLAEQSLTKNPANKQNVTITHNLQLSQSTITFNIPATPGINNLGQPITTATAYVSGTGFTGSNGTFKSTTPESYFLELITFLQIKEADAAKNPDGANNVTASYDSDENMFSGSVTLPIEVTIQTDGSIKVIADEYLRD